MIRYFSFFFLTLCAAASAEVASYQPGEGETTYEPVINAQFSVDHPFRFVHGTLAFTGGKLVADLSRPAHGMKLDLSIPMGELMTGEQKLNGAMQAILQTDQSPNIEYHSTGVVLSDQLTFPRLRFSFVGYLTIAGVTRLIPVPLTCYSEDKFLQCVIEVGFPLSDFGITPPRLFGIPSRDRVLIKGEVVFKPKG